MRWLAAMLCFCSHPPDSFVSYEYRRAAAITKWNKRNRHALIVLVDRINKRTAPGIPTWYHA
jgi:hypothetical protein